MRVTRIIALVLCLANVAFAQSETSYSKGLPKSPEFFPVAVWLQTPTNAKRYQAIGINLYVGLWNGPTEAQLNALDQAGMPVICAQNEIGLKFLDRRTIVGWMHGDEPDNAQLLGNGKGYGPPVAPQKIVESYEQIRMNDPDRPVFLNLGQGVAWDNWPGRGVRTNHPEDYAEYVKGCDIASFDIYPASHEKKEVAGKLWYVPKGVERLRRWSEGKKDVWTCIETTRISNAEVKPTPQQVRSEVWMALIQGAKGIIYFAHEFKPKFIEAGLLADQDMAKEVTDINRQIKELAPVLNQPNVTEAVTVASSRSDIPVIFMTKQHEGKTYLFVASMREGETTVRFKMPGTNNFKVNVFHENRSIAAVEGKWSDEFKNYQTHIYVIEK